MDINKRKDKATYLECRFLIARSRADDIIGPAGSNLKRLHMQYRAIINISDTGTAERILTIGGFELSAACDTLQDIINGLGPKSLLTPDSSESVFSLLLDETQVDYLTAVEEYRLNNLLEETGTNVDVFVMRCPSSTDRVIRVRGHPRSISQCIFGICELLQWFKSDAHKVPYNAENANELYVSDYGGFTFESNNVADGRQDSNEAWPSVPPQNNTTSKPDQPGTARFSIPSTLLNVFLANAGSRISQVQTESGATVTLDRDNESRGTVVIILAGRPEQISNAKLLLQMCVRLTCIRID